MKEITQKASVGSILGWAFGILFILMGISELNEKFIFAVSTLLLGIYLLPPVTQKIAKKLNLNLSGWRKLMGFFGLLIFTAIFAAIVTPSDQEEISKPNDIVSIEEDVVEQDEELPLPKVVETEKNIEKAKVDNKPLEIKEEPVKIDKEINEIKVIPDKTEEKIPENIEVVAEIVLEEVIQKNEAIIPIKTKNEIDITSRTINNHCRGEWGDDDRMFNYCVKQQNEGLNTLNRGKPGDIKNVDFQTIRQHCIGEWPTDFKMRAYCEKNQFNGVRTVEIGKPSDIGDSEFNIIRLHCKNEWSNDAKMQAYCEKNQYDAVRTLNQTTSPKRGSCVNEWPMDFKMRAYCEKN